MLRQTRAGGTMNQNSLAHGSVQNSKLITVLRHRYNLVWQLRVAYALERLWQPKTPCLVYSTRHEPIRVLKRQSSEESKEPNSLTKKMCEVFRAATVNCRYRNGMAKCPVLKSIWMQYPYHSAACASQCLSGTRLRIHHTIWMSCFKISIFVHFRLFATRMQITQCDLPSWISPCILSRSHGIANEADFFHQTQNFLSHAWALGCSDRSNLNISFDVWNRNWRQCHNGLRSWLWFRNRFSCNSVLNVLNRNGFCRFGHVFVTIRTQEAVPSRNRESTMISTP